MITPFSKILSELKLEAQISKLAIQIIVTILSQTISIEKWCLLRYSIQTQLTVKITLGTKKIIKFLGFHLIIAKEEAFHLSSKYKAIKVKSHIFRVSY